MQVVLADTLPSFIEAVSGDLDVRELLKIMIAEAALAMVLLYRFFDVHAIRAGRRAMAAFLGLLALLSVAAYVEFGYLRYGIYMNPHDFFHYYIGAKYSPELGYYNQYRCALVADMEEGQIYRRNSWIRNLSNYRHTPVADVLEHRDEYKSLFTEQRWEEFKRDIRFFQGAMPASKWNRILQDRGYNAAPVWNMVARFLANRIPTNSVVGMGLLVVLDALLILLMFAAVWWAFGWRTALFGVIFFGTNFMMSFVHIKGAFLRLDWVAGLVIATCLLKREHYRTAGLFVACAAMTRILPVVYLFGLGGKCVWKLVQHRRIDRRYLQVFVTFALGTVLLVAASCIADGGFDGWDAFFDKIDLHNKTVSTTRVGFKYIFVWPNETSAQKATAFQEHRVEWLAIQGVVLLVSLFAVRRLEDYETIPFSFVPAFFLAAPTFYYYVVLIVPFLLFAPKLAQGPRALGLAAMFAISIMLYIFHQFWNLGFTLSLAMSWLLLALAGYVVLVSFLVVPAQRRGISRLRLRSLASPLGSALRSRVLWAVIAVTAVLAVSYSSCDLQRRSATTAPGPSVGEVELVFVGDVMLSRNVAKSIEQNHRDFTFPFLSTAQYTESADIAFCNLESPLSGRGERVEKTYMFNAPPEAVEGLFYAGFDVVSLANNHILDYGPVALGDTIRRLDEVRIQQIGICENDEPQVPVVVQTKGLRIGFLAYADPAPKYAYAKEFLSFEARPAQGLKPTIQRDIEHLAGEVDVIVVSLHWGIEYKTEHDSRQEDLGRFIIDQGADVVAGHHPHVLQEPEWYRGGLIIYSLGNFVFDQHSRPATRVSRLYRVYVNTEGVTRAQYLPLEIPRHDWQPTPTSASFIPVLPIEVSAQAR